MATFKREIKKLPSEQNLRLLSSLVISLANKTSSVEDKCITPWKAEETYQKDVSFVVYNGYIYSCSVTNKDAVFTESHWTKLADNFDELSVDDIKAFLNLTPEQIQTLSSIILDAEVRLDKTWSSSKIYTDIKQCLDDSKAYTLAELGKASGASYKVVNSTTEMTEQKYIYLMSDGSGSYNMYIVEDDGSTTQIGNTAINLSDYYTKTEIDSDFLKKTDATSTYATITTVDGKVDKTDILTTKNSTATDDQVYSAKAINTELDGVVKKTDISTTIDKTSTDDTVPTNKAVYDNAIKDKKLKTYSISVVDDFSDSKTLLDIGNNLPSNSIAVVDSGYDKTSFFGLPSDKFEIVWVRRYAGRDSIMAYTATGLSYICTNIKNQTWKKVCTTSVEDVGKTFVPFTVPSSITVYNPDRPDLFGLYYIVKNGVCYVDVTMSLASISQMNNFTTLCSGMPKPAISYVRTEINSWNDKTAPTIAMAINGGESAFLIVARNMSTSPMTPSNSDGHFGYFCSFSYPVAEN